MEYWKKRVFKILGRISTKYYRVVLVVALFTTLVSAYLVQRLPVDTTFIRLLPDHSSEVQLFQKITQEFGSSTDLYLLVHFNDFDKAKLFVKDLAPELKKLSEIREVRSRFFHLKFFEKFGPLFLSLHDLQRMETLLPIWKPALKEWSQSPHLLTLLRNWRNRLEKEFLLLSLSYPRISRISEKEAIHLEKFLHLCKDYTLNGGKMGEKELQHFLESLLLSYHQSFQGRGKIQDGYLVSPEGNSMLVQIKLNIEPLQTALGMDLYGKIYQITKRVQKKKYPNIRFGYTGHFAIGYEDQQNVLTRIRYLSLLSLLAVLLLFIYLDRTVYGPVLVALPLMLAVLWTFGFVKIVFGFVSITSAIFGILLFGLGVDFAIHFMVHFHAERSKGRSMESSIIRTLLVSGPPILVGGLTTAFSFFALNVSEFKAAKHLGTTSGWGILCCLLAMLVLLPSLLIFLKKFLGSKGEIPIETDIPLIHKWVSWSLAHPRWIFFLTFLLTLVSLFGCSRLQLQYDLEQMITLDLPSIATKKELEKEFHLSTDFIFLVAKSEEKARKYVKKLLQARKKNGKPMFSRVDSITNYIPENQAEKLKILKRLQSAIQDISFPDKASPLVSQELPDLLKELGKIKKIIALFQPLWKNYPQLSKEAEELIQSVEKNHRLENLNFFQNLLYKQFYGSITAFQKISLKPIGLKSLPLPIQESFLGKNKHNYQQKNPSFAVYAYPSNSVFDKENIEEVLHVVRNISSESTGQMIMIYHFIYLGLQDFPLLLATVLILVLILLFLDFRSFILVGLALIPIGIGALWSVGFMVLAGEPFHILSIIAFPLVFGIGIDDGVHVIHRYLESPSGKVEEAVATTAKAILMTTLTTMASFGILLLTHHAGFISMGKLILLGVGLCFFTSITILPPLLSLAKKWRLLS